MYSSVDCTLHIGMHLRGHLPLCGHLAFVYYDNLPADGSKEEERCRFLHMVDSWQSCGSEKLFSSREGNFYMNVF